MHHFKQIILILVFSIVLVFNQARAFESVLPLPELNQEIDNKVVAIISLDVEITEQKTDDSRDANQNWSNLARINILSALEALLLKTDTEFPGLAETAMLENPQALQIIALQSIINLSILGHVQSPLPSKQHFDWSQGPDISLLQRYVEADLGLFLFVRAGIDTDLPTPQYQAGFVSLVDLKNGNTIWFDHATQINGDFRDTAGAIMAMKTLMKNFPTTNYTDR